MFTETYKLHFSINYFTEFISSKRNTEIQSHLKKGWNVIKMIYFCLFNYLLNLKGDIFQNFDRIISYNLVKIFILNNKNFPSREI